MGTKTYRETPIVDGVTITFPNKGDRVRLPMFAELTGLAGMQMKVGAHEGAEG